MRTIRFAFIDWLVDKLENSVDTESGYVLGDITPFRVNNVKTSAEKLVQPNLDIK